MFLKWRDSRRPSRDSRRTIEDLARSLALILEPSALRASIANRVRELIGCDAVVVCAFGVKENAFAGEFPSSAGEPPQTITFPGAGPLVKWLRVNEEPLVLPHPGGAFDDLDPVEKAALTSVGARACVPVFAGPRLIALLIVCSIDPSWRLRPDDSELLVRLGRQAGLALQNAELQSLERERLRNVYRAEQLAVAGQLAATVAHEVRNPLTAIRSSVQFTLQSSAEWATKQRLLEGVLQAVDRIDQTIGSVLALSRPDDAEFGDVDLVRTVEESLLMTEAYARAHDIAVVRQFEVPSLIVRGNRRSLVQVCVNLFLNSCQAMGKGGKATLRCAVTDPSIDPPSAVLQIRDTGPGIAKEHLEKVFDPFFTTKDGGTGLGLPICLDLVTRHNGQLRLDSELGQGTTATILLPLPPP
jgi:two-component system, NtrC family, sensor kinase